MELGLFYFRVTICLLEETKCSVFSLISMIFQNILQKFFGLPINKQYNDNSNKTKNDDDKDNLNELCSILL